MSTPIITVAVQVEIMAWTPPASGSGLYTAQATLVAADNSTNVTVANNIITITAPLGSPVQINLNPWTDLAGLTFTLGAPCNLKAPSGDITADYSILLVDRSGFLTGSGSGGLQWTLNGIAYAISPIPYNGAAVIDLNNASGENQAFSYDIMLMDSNGHWGIFDPEVINDPA
jgi:hypothetical protein